MGLYPRDLVLAFGQGDGHSLIQSMKRFCICSIVLLGLADIAPAKAQLDLATLGGLGQIAWRCGYNSQFDIAYGLSLGAWRSNFTRRAHAQGASQAQLSMLMVDFEAGIKDAKADGLKPGRQFTSEQEESEISLALREAYMKCAKAGR